MKTPREEAHALLLKLGRACAGGHHPAPCDDVTAAIEAARADGLTIGAAVRSGPDFAMAMWRLSIDGATVTARQDALFASIEAAEARRGVS